MVNETLMGKLLHFATKNNNIKCVVNNLDYIMNNNYTIYDTECVMDKNLVGQTLST